MSAKRSGPGPEEERELTREAQREAHDDVRADLEKDAVEEDDGEATYDEILEIDAVENDELGLALDDPHQPDGE